MKPQAFESISSAIEVFSATYLQLQAASDTASDLGLVVPNSFPDTMDHLQAWITNAETEVRELLQAVSPLER